MTSCTLRRPAQRIGTCGRDVLRPVRVGAGLQTVPLAPDSLRRTVRRAAAAAAADDPPDTAPRGRRARRAIRRRPRPPRPPPRPHRDRPGSYPSIRAGRISLSRIEAGKRRALQLLDGVEQRVGAAPPLDDALPGGGEPAEHRLIHRLDLVAQLGERAPPKQAQHARVGPLPLDASGPEPALEQAALRRSVASAAPRRPARPTRSATRHRTP